MTQPSHCLAVRPYQLIHIICKIGAGMTDDLGDERLTEILRLVRSNPILPLVLRCNVSSIFRYQNPGRDEDTPEGPLFNDRRDLHILQKLGLAPGDTRPAIMLFQQILEAIETGDGICDGGRSDSDTWREQSGVTPADYAKGRALGLGAIIPPRTDEDMARAKAETAKSTLEADHLYLRPHHAMCMSCFYGRRLEAGEPLAPIAPDNLYEAIIAIHRNPEIPITLIEGPCMICPPCQGYDPKTKLCIAPISMGLRDEKKDLDVLYRLDLKYGDTLPAKEFFTRLHDEIHSTTDICGHGDGIVRSPEWRVCGGPNGEPGYLRARKDRLGIPGLCPGKAVSS